MMATKAKMQPKLPSEKIIRDEDDELEQCSNIMVMNGYNANATLINTPQPEIVVTIRKLPIEQEVIYKAISLFYQISNSKIGDSNGNSVEMARRSKSVKGGKKTRLIFYCVFMAYYELDAVDPYYAADIVGLSRNEIELAFNEYAPPGLTLFEPERMVKFYIRRVNEILKHTGVDYNVDVIDKEVKKVISVCRSTPAGKEWIENTAAKTVAIAALYFYMNDIRNLEFTKTVNIFEHACYLSWACIRRYHEQIAKYYNYDIEQKSQLPIVYYFDSTLS